MSTITTIVKNYTVISAKVDQTTSTDIIVFQISTEQIVHTFNIESRI